MHVFNAKVFAQGNLNEIVSVATVEAFYECNRWQNQNLYLIIEFKKNHFIVTKNCASNVSLIELDWIKSLKSKAERTKEVNYVYAFKVTRVHCAYLFIFICSR